MNAGKLVTINKPVQLFEQFGGEKSHMMARHRISAAEGSYLLLGEPTTMSFNHGDHAVAAVRNLPPGFFVLLSEVEEAVRVETTASPTTG